MSLLDSIGVQLPVVQAPMAGVQGHALAAAVCGEGGLGSVPCAMLTPTAMREELGKLRALTSRPFNVNFFCHTAPSPHAGVEAQWLSVLRSYYEELGVPIDAQPLPAVRSPFDDAAADVLEDIKPAVVSFHFGLPSSSLLSRVRSIGSKVVGCATTVDEARWLEAHGVDAIVAQGIEAGGHRGMFLSSDLSTQVSTRLLVQQVINTVHVPVIAAGGIADARDVEAVLALGAAAAQVGTAYLLCPEATTSQTHRAALQSPAALHTEVSNVFTGRPARGIVNRFMSEQGPLNPLAPPFPLAATALAPLRKAAEAGGSSEFSPLWCGQVPPRDASKSAADLTRDLAR